MKSITHIAYLVIILIYSGQMMRAQTVTAELRSRRSSICSIMIKHDEQKFADEIETQFNQIPISDRFNDHNLSVRVVKVNNKELSNSELEAFISNNKIASRLVAKWFDRNILTGECSTDTLCSRGLYDASVFDKELASKSVRGYSMLEDAGEDLIGNTYLLLHEINYVDKSRRSQFWASIGGIAMGVLMAAGGADASSISGTMQNTAEIISTYKGFSVKIRTRLYRLLWDEESSLRFYNECYTTTVDETRKTAFENLRPIFKMEYMGEVVSSGAKTSFLGINEESPQLMVRKACARAIDENIADLQHKFEPFRIKSLITEVSPFLKSQIGRKEGITPESKFEVLEILENNGKITYHRVGIVKPVANKIWDNRYMSDKECATNYNLGATFFEKISGGDFYPGMLLREID